MAPQVAVWQQVSVAAAPGRLCGEDVTRMKRMMTAKAGRSVTRRAGAGLLLLAASAGLGGCAMSGAGSAVSPSAATTGIHGKIYGGNQPVTGATVQLFAVGTNGYGTAATPLLTTPVTTSSGGFFNITGDYSCPSSGTPVYLLVTGGNPGMSAGTYNSALAMMTLLGPCGNLGPSTFVVINELTTVAAVWAMAPFMVDSTHIGTSSTNLQGLQNAVAVAQNLVSTATGTAPGNAPALATLPTSELNTLADILSACVNSNGSTGSGTSCGQLFTAATPAGGVAPTDTVLAALDIARNPSHDAGAIYSTLASNGPFQPTLSSAPSDWTLAITYTSSAFATPSDLAIDSQGNAWVVATPANSSNSVVSVLNYNGVAGSYTLPNSSLSRIALDANDDPWLSSTINSNLVLLTNSGTRVGNAITAGGINGPGQLVFDGNGYVWVANNNATMTKLTPSGTAYQGSPYATGAAAGPVGIAVDTTGAVWVANSASNSVTVLSSNGTQALGSPYTAGGLNGPFSLAIDSTNGAWVANEVGSSLSRLSNSGDGIAGSPYYGGGLNTPIELALDGLGNVWLVNSGNNSVSEFLSSGKAQSGLGGYGSATLSTPYRLALDRSGNVWVASLGSTSTGAGKITQIVGAAAPVVTPASLAIQNNALNQRP
ncbi:MAG: NHL repeat-containing protein [Acidobacteriota bacterium]|nr:NHL repeat-containing protein [Acidobacteriota bacterium]